MKVWIGTSGYSYPDWVGSFYPPGTRPNRMLAHYAQHFPLVELNFTFYRPPTPDVLARIADQTPDGFGFLVKVPRTISHEESPRDLPLFRRSIEELRHRGRLFGLLCQLPQAHHFTRQRLGWLDALGRQLGEYRLAVEFRHRSWARPDVAPWLGERGLDLVSVDAPDVGALYPRGLVRSTRRAYVRLHSRSAGNWYLSDKERYDYTYDDAALGEWVEALLHSAELTDEAFILFNNCVGAQAVVNARRAADLFRRRLREADVVAPFASATALPVQRGLFDELRD